MIEITGNLWDFVGKGYIVIPTNGVVTSLGKAVMGAGLAKEAALRYPKLPYELGEKIEATGNQVYAFHQYHLIALPTKEHYKSPSELLLIAFGCRRLYGSFVGETIYLPRLGCGLGGLKWEDVKPVMAKHLIGDRFVVVSQ